MYRTIVIATDGSETASRAVRVGAGLAKATGATAVLVHVGDPDEGREVLERASADTGVDAKGVTVTGDPADKILEVAESEGADLIVIGNKGMTGPRRFLLGSVPNQVSHHAGCNVLIVKTT